jgi:general secretion pathway protein I
MPSALCPEGRAGFTLLEVLVSLAIVAIVLVAVFKLHSQTILMSQEVDFYVSAPLLASARLAEIEAEFPEMPTDGSGDFGENFPGYSWRLTVSDVDVESLGEVSEDLKQLDMAVSFNGGERNFQLRTFRLVR